MLTIRNEQMAAFRAAQRLALVRRLAAQARAAHPAALAGCTAPALEQALDKALRAALAQGCIVLADQVRFALQAVAQDAAQSPGAPTATSACR